VKKTIFILLLVPLVSCSSFFKKKTERALARVQDEYLYESEIKGLISHGTSAADSITIVKNYIDSWIQKKLLVEQARNNLPEQALDFTSQLAEYENSLIIYAYENALVDQKLDTVVTPGEIESYYNTNLNNFLLKDNIVKMQYVKLPRTSTQIRQVKKLLQADDPVSLTQLSELCEKQAADYFLDSENWLSFPDVLREIPVKTYNQEEFLRTNRNFEYQDSSFVYIIRIRDFRIKDNVSPLSYEEIRIRNIILNKRKIELINNMRRDVYNAAVKKNGFEIY
jgi:hypothetical protein